MRFRHQRGKVLHTIALNKPFAEAVSIMTGAGRRLACGFRAWPHGGNRHLSRGAQCVHDAGRDWPDLTVSKAMIGSPMVAAPDMEMDELRKLMVDHHHQRLPLPVMDEGTLLGVVSFHDVAKGVLEEQSFENRMLKNYIRNGRGNRRGLTVFPSAQLRGGWVDGAATGSEGWAARWTGHVVRPRCLGGQGRNHCRLTIPTTQRRQDGQDMAAELSPGAREIDLEEFAW